MTNTMKKYLSLLAVAALFTGCEASSTSKDDTNLTEGGSNAAMSKNLSALTQKINNESARLMTMLEKSNPEMKDSLKDSMEAFKKGDMEEALNEFKDVYQGHITPEQMEVAKDFASHLQAFALESEFKTTEGPVGKAIDAIRAQDPQLAMTSLQELLQKGQLSSNQKDVVEEIMKYYAGSVDAAKDSLKGFGF